MVQVNLYTARYKQKVASAPQSRQTEIPLKVVWTAQIQCQVFTVWRKDWLKLLQVRLPFRQVTTLGRLSRQNYSHTPEKSTSHLGMSKCLNVGVKVKVKVPILVIERKGQS